MKPNPGNSGIAESSPATSSAEETDTVKTSRPLATWIGAGVIAAIALAYVIVLLFALFGDDRRLWHGITPAQATVITGPLVVLGALIAFFGQALTRSADERARILSESADERARILSQSADERARILRQSADEQARRDATARQRREWTATQRATADRGYRDEVRDAYVQALKTFASVQSALKRMEKLVAIGKFDNVEDQIESIWPTVSGAIVELYLYTNDKVDVEANQLARIFTDRVNLVREAMKPNGAPLKSDYLLPDSVAEQIDRISAMMKEHLEELRRRQWKFHIVDPPEVIASFSGSGSPEATGTQPTTPD